MRTTLELRAITLGIFDCHDTSDELLERMIKIREMRQKRELRAITLGILDYHDMSDELLERMIKIREMFERIFPPTYDEPGNAACEYYHNGKPLAWGKECPTLAVLRAEAKKCGLKRYHRLKKDSLRKLLAEQRFIDELDDPLAKACLRQINDYSYNAPFSAR